MKLVRIQSDPNGPSQTWIKNAETGETIHGVKAIDIHIGIMELPVATMEVWTEFDGLAKPRWKPAFDRAGRCESCMWWGTEVDEEGRSKCVLLSNAELAFDEDGTLENANTCRDHAFAHSVGDYGYPSAFFTSPDFGCVQWEPKEGD